MVYSMDTMFLIRIFKKYFKGFGKRVRQGKSPLSCTSMVTTAATSLRFIMNLIVESKMKQRVLDWLVSQAVEQTPKARR